MQSAPFINPLPPVQASASRDDSKQPAPSGSLDSQVGSPILREKRVVIVEDEGLTLMQLRKICSLVGMQVVGTASDGEQGVQKVLAARPDLVLMDVKMPMLDGFAAAERILKELPVCIVMLTAYDLPEHKARARTLGTCGYILKPVAAVTLIPQLEAAFDEFQRKPK